jgi:hypothetical protein
MREASDQGMDNHLGEYLDNLCANYEGAYVCYPELSSIREMAEVQSNLCALKANLDLDFGKWRSTVLRSTRLIQTILTRDYGEV